MKTNIISLVSGDAVDINLEFKDKNQDNLDMTGTFIKLTVKDKDGNIIITKDSEIPIEGDPLTNEISWGGDEGIDIENGQAITHFVEADSASYEGVYDYDVQIEKDTHIYTPIKSFLIISKDVTE